MFVPEREATLRAIVTKGMADSLSERGHGYLTCRMRQGNKTHSSNGLQDEE